MPQRISARRVKKHRAYRIDQLADAVGVTPQTVRRWCKEGLPCLTDNKPFLIRGQDFKSFHDARLKARKRSRGPFEIFCLGCDRSRRPEPGLVDFEMMAAQRARIVMLCSHCGSTAGQFISIRDLPEWAARFGLQINSLEDA